MPLGIEIGKVHAQAQAGQYNVKTISGMEKRMHPGCRSTLLLASVMTAVLTAQDWPSWSGPYANMIVDQSANTKLTDAPNEISKLWKSEQFILNGRGPAARYGCCAGDGLCATPSGGAGSPIYYDGKVYLYYFQPSGPYYDTEKVDYVRANCDTSEILYDPWIDYWKLDGDDVFLCLDAYTGKTIWKTVLTGKAGYCPIDFAKNGCGAYNITAMDGKVFATNNIGRVYGLDAACGEVLWENHVGSNYMELKRMEKAAQDNMSFSLCGALYGRGSGFIEHYRAGVIVTHGGGSQMVAYDAATGDLLWRKYNAIGGNAHPSKYYEDGKEYLVCANEGKGEDGQLRMIEPLSGEELWTLSGVEGNYHSILVYEDTVFCFVESDAAGKWTDGRQGAFQISTSGADLLWKLPERNRNSICGYAYHKGDLFVRKKQTNEEKTAGDADPTGVVDDTTRGIWIIKQATGEIVNKVFASALGSIQGTGVTLIADDKLFFEIDGNHGGNSEYLIFSIDQADLTRIGSMPPPNTSVYERTMTAPIVRGRMYRREYTGICAYDLRRPSDVPSATLTHPADGATISNTASKTLRATASDAAGIDKVVFYVNGENVGEDNSAPYETTWENHVPGEYFAYAVAYNTKGYDNGSQPVTVTLAADNCESVPRAVTAKYPDNGTEVQRTRTPVLQWSWAGEMRNVPTEYELFFGEDGQDMEKIADLNGFADSSFSIPTPLAIGKTYHWRVDALNQCGASPGETSSFTLREPEGFRFLRMHVFKSGGLGFRIYSAQWLTNGEELVPLLASNGEQGLELSATQNHERAYYAYDGDESTEWGSSEEASNTIDFGVSAELNPDQISLKAGGGSRAPDSLRFEGSYFGDDWYSIGVITDFPEDNLTVDLEEPRLIVPATETTLPRRTLALNPPRIFTAGGRINLQIPQIEGIGKCTVRVFDAFGRTIFARAFHENDGIATDVLPNGIYLVQIVDAAGTVGRKQVCLYR